MSYQLFSPEYVEELSESEKWIAYEKVKKALRDNQVSESEYNIITDIAIKELGL